MHPFGAHRAVDGIDLSLTAGEVLGILGPNGAGKTPIILMSTHAEQDYRELITTSPAIGFLSRTALSAHAIHDLLEAL